MTHVCAEWPLDRVLDAAVRYGYHGVEFRIDAKNLHGVEVTATAAERRAIRAQLERTGIEPCCVATSLYAYQEQVLNDAPARIQLAADIGCPGIRIFCGMPLPEGMTTVQAIARCGRHLAQLAPLAEKAGVGLWLETHDTLCKAADAMAAIRLAGHPAVALNFDMLHSFRMGEPLETSLACASGFVRHTHFHDAVTGPGVLDIVPFGRGNTPLDAMLKGLVTIGYDGYVSGEFFPGNFDPDPERSIEIFRDDIVGLMARNHVAPPQHKPAHLQCF